MKKKIFISALCLLLIFCSSFYFLVFKEKEEYKKEVGKISVLSYEETLYAETEYGYEQKVTNDGNSALIQGDLFTLYIHDHNYQGMYVIRKVKEGDTATLTLYGETYTLTCAAVYRHSVETDYDIDGLIVIRTCEILNGNIVTLWECEELDIFNVSFRLLNERN